jgi:hypothetical protein
MRCRRDVTFVVVFVLLGAARAQAATIVIVRPATASPELTETVSRLQGELLSLGLGVAFAESGVGPAPRLADPRARLQPLATARDADAVIEIEAELGAPTVDIYVLDRRTRRSEVSRVAVGSSVEDGPARLAIRTIEVLRSQLVEIDLAARARAGAIDVRAPRRAAPETPAPAAAADRVALEAGGAVLTGVDGVGPALLPTVRVEWATRWGLMLHGALAGLGSRPTLTALAGSARVAQQFGVLGIGTGAPPAQRMRPDVGASAPPFVEPFVQPFVQPFVRPFVQPFVALAAGVLHTEVDGDAEAPAEGHAVDRWSFLVDASAGARIRLPGRMFVTPALHVQVAAPYVAVHIGDRVVATTGRPNLLFTLTVGAWL